MRRAAERAGVAGSATNEDDGSVTVVLEGDAGAVDSLVAFCRDNPGSSRVDDVAVADEEPEGLSGFTTR